MISLLEIFDKTQSGPICLEKDFDLTVYAQRLRQLVKEYNIKHNVDEPLSQNLEMADVVFEAGVKLAADVGLLCLNTQRRITFSEEELWAHLKTLPNSIELGEGNEKRIMKHRNVCDSHPPILQMGTLGQPTSEKAFVKETEVFAKLPLIDTINMGSLITVHGRQVRMGSPLEIEASKMEIRTVRKTLEKVAKPGMHILGTESSVSIGDLAVSSSEGGLRKSDGHLVALTAELKTNYNALSNVFHVKDYGGFICGLYDLIMGGYAGGPEGVAITKVAGSILLSIAHRADYSITGTPCDITYAESPSEKKLRQLFWAHSIATQAISRNSKLLVGGTAAGAAGPGTQMLFYETAATTIMHVTSGCAFIETCFPLFNRYPDRPAPLEALYTGEIAHSATQGKLTLEEGNTIINRIFDEKLSCYMGSAPPQGKTFDQTFDLEKLAPTSEYLATYNQARKEFEDLTGFRLD